MKTLRNILATVVLAGSMIATPLALIPSAQAAWSCDATTPNTEFRWGIKSLSDADRKTVDYHPVRKRLAALRKFPRPGYKVVDATPRIAPEEMTTYRIRGRMIEARMEKDGDVILVLSAPRNPNRTMIVEYGNPRCVTRQFKRKAIGKARRQVRRACGPLNQKFTKLSGIASVKGVGFWDNTFERGTAPNKFQLWPGLSFRGSCNHA